MVDVLIQTCNEELNLPNTLRSVQGWAHRIFVVDSGSTDRTVEIAREFGATVVVHPWEGYAAQKNWALDNLPWESPWILILDADEAASPELRDEILSVVNRPPDTVNKAGFYINRVLIFLGQRIYHCGYFPSWNLRLFKRGKARYEDRAVHEHMIVDGNTGYLKQLIIHEDRRGLEHFIAKHNRYSTLEAQSIYDSKATWPGLWRMIFDRMARTRFLKDRVFPLLPVPWLFRLFYMYVLRMGFLDRRGGWVLCNFIATYDLFVIAKYRELVRLKGRRPPHVNGLALPEGKMSVQDTAPQPAPLPRGVVAGSVYAPAGSAVPADRSDAPTATAPPAASRPARVAVPVRREPPRIDKAAVSILIPTCNSAADLPRCLDHLHWADEVVLADRSSTDQTRSIAESYGARVVNIGEGATTVQAKCRAIDSIDFKHEWVLIVAPNEWVTPELAAEVATAIRSDRYTGYCVDRQLILLGHRIKHCVDPASGQLRLIRRGGADMCNGELESLIAGSAPASPHATASGPGNMGRLDHGLLHFASVRTLCEEVEQQSASQAAAEFQEAAAVRAYRGPITAAAAWRHLKHLARRLPFRALGRFLYGYIGQGGLLDGRAGYVFCRMMATRDYLANARFHELNTRELAERAARSFSKVPPTAAAGATGPSAPSSMTVPADAVPTPHPDGSAATSSTGVAR